MDDLAEVYPELNVPGSAPNDVYSQVMGSDTYGIVQTLGKGASPGLVYGPVCKRSQAEKRDFDTRVEMEVQKATSAMKIEMTEKMYEAKKEMEAMDKKLLEAKEEAKENNEVMERKLSEAKMDMEEIIADKVKEGIQAYVESLGINIDANLKSEQVPDNPLEDCQQPSAFVPGVHTRKANMIKKTGTSVVGTNKKKIFKEIEVKYRLQHARLLD
uniref:Leucine-rich repeat resistance protein n=1 Tax=Solanum tuberosum TaxID=4113 RepID=M0ZYB0_SOLTU